jgi:predicted ATPase
MTRLNFYIITGGPGSGKTSIIEELRKRGVLCVDEVARSILKEQNAIGGDATHLGDRRKYCELMLSRSMFTYNRVQETRAPVFFDRGIPELAGYRRFTEADVPAHFHKAIEVFRYNPVVFVAPPWEDIYRNDEERIQDYREAVETYEAIMATYPQFGYRLVEIPRLPVSERAQFLIDYVR